MKDTRNLACLIVGKVMTVSGKNYLKKLAVGGPSASQNSESQVIENIE